MSSIDDLIAELAPEGVESKTLGEVLRIKNGKDHKSLGDGDIPVYGSGGIMRYVDAAAAEGPSVLIPRKGSLGNIFYVEGPFWVVDTIFRTEIDTSQVEPKFVYHQLLTMKLGEMNQAGGVPSQTQTVLNSLRIPVPPLEVQREIVRVLDQFTQLEAELEAELEARRRQYEHYRTELLADAAALGRLVELGELGRIVTGRTPKSSDSSAWGDHLDFVTPSDIKNGMKRIHSPARQLSISGAEALSKAIVPEGSLLVTCIGADMGKTVLNANACATNQQINSLTPNSGIATDFVFHVLTSMRDEIRAQGERAGGTMPIINKSDFSKIRIALPPLEEQQRVARILDQFDALVNDLSVGLPAELTARRKQYEYYRDKLLSFREAD
ncbi:restriction endonuclease subunit S [Paenarthrobacter sp. NPDC090517]|uniref:restriction endonuclease subunit S n=1 Tax=Paenarthrobacter sp. NPDC090517 TaxID=3364381 RepID=UPI00380576DC